MVFLKKSLSVMLGNFKLYLPNLGCMKEHPVFAVINNQPGFAW